MRRWGWLLLVILLIPGLAGADLRAGVEAYNRGDYATALKEFEVRARAGDDQAQLLLGLMHDNGMGTPQDYAKAFEWYRQAAEAGNARAQFNVGEMLSAGQGVDRDRTGAASWYGRAAENGYAEAQYKYGVALAAGDGIAEDVVEAWKWLDIAARREDVEGNEVAVAAREELQPRMSPAQVSEASERSARWREDFERRKRERRIEI